MAINKKSSSVVPVSREGLGFTLTSANQDAYPVAYSDDIWSIVKQGTKISAVVGEASIEEGSICACPSETGTYTVYDLIEAVSAYAIQTAIDLNLAISAGGAVETMINEKIDALDSTVSASTEDFGPDYTSASTRNFTIKIEQTNGLITSVSMEVPDLDNIYDVLGSAAEVLGKDSDTSATTTVYGAFAAIEAAKNGFAAAIAALDSEAEDTNNGVKVKVTEVDGKITSVEVTCDLLGAPTDTSSDMTLYGIKKYANEEILGDNSDTKDDKTVYGAFAYGDYILGLLNDFKASRIPDDDIRALFC